VSVNDSISLSSIENGGTWELWIKPNSDLRQSKWIGFLDTAPGLVGAIQALVDPSNRLRACFGGVHGAMWSIDSDWTGEWHHIVGTWNRKVNPTVTLYVDGVQKAQATPTVTVKVDLLHIGSMNYRSFDGVIDEVRIWDVALSATEIAQSYALGTNNTGVTALKHKNLNGGVAIFTSAFLVGSSPSFPITVNARAMIVGSTAEVSSLDFRKVTPGPPGRETVSWTPADAYDSSNTLIGYDIEVTYKTDRAKSLHLSMVLDTDKALGVNVQFLP